MPELDGALDVDLAVTPFTNTLPIRRLGLATGGSADIVVVYVGFPDLNVTLEPQRYTRVDDRRYRFASLDGDLPMLPSMAWHAEPLHKPPILSSSAAVRRATPVGAAHQCSS